MADPRLVADMDAGDGSRLSGRESKPPTPRWVKAFAMVAAVLIVILVIGILTGQAGPGGRHGPSRHVGGIPANAAPSSGPPNRATLEGPADAAEAPRAVEITIA